MAISANRDALVYAVVDDLKRAAADRADRTGRHRVVARRIRGEHPRDLTDAARNFTRGKKK
jgi:hypothetical protein